MGGCNRVLNRHLTALCQSSTLQQPAAAFLDIKVPSMNRGTTLMRKQNLAATFLEYGISSGGSSLMQIGTMSICRTL